MSDTATLAPMLAPYLLPGETVRWAGQPDARLLRRPLATTWMIVLPFALFVTLWLAAFMVLPYEGSALVRLAAMLFGGSFLALFAWMLWLPVRAIRTAHAQVYAITDRRLVSITGSGEAAAVRESIALDRVLRWRSARRGAGGDLVVDHGHDTQGRRHYVQLRMLGIADPDAAEAALAQGRLASPSAG